MNAYHHRKQTLNSADIWLVYAQARRKTGDYDSAKLWIKKAIDLEPLNVDVQRERKTINLRDERHLVEKPTVFNTCIASLNDQRPWCNILSIDGGGIRGIIPAVWLMEIERKLQQPISSIFHVIAGISTGAIVAAGLSVPSDTQAGRPRYQAYDLVQLYQTKADKVFTKSPSMWATISARYLQAPQYLDDGRQTVFEEYFNTLKLSDSLTELIVPSVRAESNITDIFTRQSAVNDLSKNFSLKDVLMCTTAAPTYFPAYSFNNTVYVDGGVQANNPAMIAYSHSLHVNRNSSDGSRIRLLSLGTGDYVPDPLHPTARRDILFWQRNHQTVLKTVMDGPQNNIDMQLGDIIGDNYYRWQVWLENPIKLDDIQSNTIDRLVDIAHEQLEEMEGYDNCQRLGCLIEKLRLSNEL